MRITLTALIAGLGVLAAGCGGGGGSTNANTPQQGAADAGFKFARCMRTHGVPDFPDPHTVTENGHSSSGLVFRVPTHNTPAFKSAQKACEGILPMPTSAQIAQQQHAREVGVLVFARCVRAHGITNFPDPNAQGNLTPEITSTAGIDIHSPAVLSAAKACIPASDGQVSAAAVARAEAGG